MSALRAHVGKSFHGSDLKSTPPLERSPEPPPASRFLGQLGVCTQLRKVTHIYISDTVTRDYL